MLGIRALVLAPLLVGGAIAVAGIVVGLLHGRRHPARAGMLRWGLGLSVAGLLVALACGYGYYRLLRVRPAQVAGAEATLEDDAGEHASWVGQPAPPLQLTTVDGEKVDLRQFAGRPVVLNLWATWCPPCRVEFPHLDRLAREVPTVVVLAVSDEDRGILRSFLAMRPVSFRVASAPHLPPPYDEVRSLPTTIFIDGRGIVRRVHVGYQDFAALKSRALAAD